MDIIMMRENEASLAVTDRGKAELETRSEKLDTQALALRGAVLVLIQFDVCEEIKLDQLRQIFGARTLEQPSFKHPTPGYVRYQRPPVVEPIEPLILETGERLEGQIKYYDYGVLSVGFELPFSGDWDTLVRLGSLAVISWNAAFLYDSAVGAETAIQLLEYANSQLLEFRHYDELLTRELEGVCLTGQGDRHAGTLAPGPGRNKVTHGFARRN